MVTVPKIGIFGGSEPWFIIKDRRDIKKELFNSKVKIYFRGN